MADRPFPGFLGPLNADPQFITWSNEYTQNLVMRMLRPPTRGRPGQWALRGTPGLKRFASSGSGYPLDLFAFNEELFAADRTALYSVSANADVAALGALVGDTRPVKFATSAKLGNQMGILAGGALNILTLNVSPRTLVQVTDPGFLTGAKHLSFSDGYFIANLENDILFGLSGLLAGFDWSTLDAGRKSQTVDNLRGHMMYGTLILLLGLYDGELWGNSGDPSFPYSPIDDVIIKYGLAASETLIDADGPCWLGQTKHGSCAVVELEGYTAVPWSPEGMNEELSDLAAQGKVADARAWTYQRGDTTYYVLKLPTADCTYVGDRSTKLWHRWSTFDIDSGTEHAHMGRSHAFCYGRHFVSDEFGRIYTLEGDTDDGRVINRVRATSHVEALQHRLTYNALRLYVQSGDAPLNDIDEYVNPKARLEYSDDAGRTWSGPLFADLGPRGQFGRRLEWLALGSSEIGRQFRVSFALPQFIGISGAILDLQEG